ncbi:15-hydroxyprostaglandin dehydrogenase [Diplodia corticola]|uniref:15-hydroxyprostaglandin dehydrogenase n=1 Tax=Diplodia corticola TaxID=236234 RepID=A0A1J9RL52_9PEZI|nr:15-hydroxyprostaglandin dehydrogenase [Diplodia corticola]OJD29239.1 15-hydroxyprostaglandin dehydrogenase [Diplodia corticola]
MGDSRPVQKKVAIVTGATSGIGIDLARDLVSRNYKVAVVGRRASAGEQIAASLNDDAGDDDRAHFFAADVSSYASQAAMFRAVWARWGRIDALCANAGIVDQSSAYLLDGGAAATTTTNIDDVPPAPDLACTDADWKGVVYGTRLAVHFMRQNAAAAPGPGRGGKVVVTGSVAAVFPHPTYPEYCGAKAAVAQFVRAAAPVWMRRHGVAVNVVHPGIVDTPIVPREMIEAVSAECLTPVETVLRAYRLFLDDETGMTGKNVEASGDKLHFYELPDMGNGEVTKRSVTVWEPLFAMMHHEKSGLPDAIN